MEVNLQSVFVGLNSEVTGQKQRISFHGRVPCSQKTRFFNHKRDIDHERRNFSVACAASPALEVQRAASKSHFKDFTVSPHPRRDRDIKVRVDASGAMTQAIFDDVFSKLVEAAQPIHGFRRTKGAYGDSQPPALVRKGEDRPLPALERKGKEVKVRTDVHAYGGTETHQSNTYLPADGSGAPGGPSPQSMVPAIIEIELASTTIQTNSAKPMVLQIGKGKTPDIPNDVLLHVLGASKVNRQTIKKIINLIIAEYVEKEGLNVAKDLRVHQSYEELEEMFVPGKEFGFDATIQLQETK